MNHALLLGIIHSGYAAAAPPPPPPPPPPPGGGPGPDPCTYNQVATPWDCVDDTNNCTTCTRTVTTTFPDCSTSTDVQQTFTCPEPVGCNESNCVSTTDPVICQTVERACSGNTCVVVGVFNYC